MCTAALNAARRVNDFPTAVRIFEGTSCRPGEENGDAAPKVKFPFTECTFAHTTKTSGIKSKVENKEQYQQYLKELEPLRKELGVELKEDLYPETTEEH